MFISRLELFDNPRIYPHPNQPTHITNSSFFAGVIFLLFSMKFRATESNLNITEA